MSDLIIVLGMIGITTVLPILFHYHLAHIIVCYGVIVVFNFNSKHCKLFFGFTRDRKFFNLHSKI